MFEKKDEVISRLIQCKLFSGVDEAELDWLIGQPGCSVKYFHPEAIIAFRGDQYERLLIVLEGSLRAELQDYRGKVLKVESLKRGEAVATAILFAADNLLPVTLTSESESYVCAIPKQTILQFMQRSRRFLENIISDMGDRVSLLADKIFSLQFSTIKQKISAYLLDLSAKQGTDNPEIRVTKEGLAEIFGVTRPALSRCFSEMVQAGLFEQDGKIIFINNRIDLEAILEDE